MLSTIGRTIMIGALGGALSTAPAATEFQVINNGFTSYTIDGQTNPSLTFQRDSTYIFHINALQHPFWINTVPSTGTGNAYNSGVTNNGIEQGDLTFIVPSGAPDQLYYNCQYHSPMTGTITIETIIAAGPVAYYPFNGNANDESGNGNNGTVNGTTLTADRFENPNSAYSFNGLDNFIQIQHSSNLTPAKYTVVLWYKADSYHLGEMIAKGIDKHYYQIQFDSGTLSNTIEFWYEDESDADYYILTQQGYNVGQYFMATMVYENQILKAYIDGQLIEDKNFTAVPYNDGDDLYIGKGNNGYFHGTIDDIRIYNRALSASEIDSLYQLGGWPVPDAPTNLTATPGAGQIDLTWVPNSEADFLRYRIYGGTAANPMTQVDSTTAGINDTTATITGLSNDTTYYYRITAVDSAGNESDYSAEVSAIVLSVAAGMPVPDQYALHQNYPNPFNPSTMIQFDLPEAATVRLIVYDIIGREVALLKNEPTRAGYHTVVWNGKDHAGREVPSGIYIARLVTPGYGKSIKMLLLK